jgi:hypothetical protein
MNKIIKLCHKIFKRTLGIYWLGSGEKVGTVISKAFIKDVSINTVDVLENGKYYFHSHIEITTVDNRVYKVNTHESYVRYIPDIPHKMGLLKYNKYIMKLIKSPFCDYTLENRSDTTFESNS